MYPERIYGEEGDRAVTVASPSLCARLNMVILVGRLAPV